MTVALTGQEGKTLGFLLRGRLTEADYTEVLLPALDAAIDQHEEIRVLLQVKDFEGWTVGGAWEDLTNWPKWRQIERMAVVTDESWDTVMTWMMKVFAGLTDMDLQFFREERLAEAWDWLHRPEA
ncbi:hypothetical protein ABH15_09635 [Methanoculleus taiwanensis]|uniref:Uncharacterized protein n=1 Tax=Methanoculleus taiwanensis TaxID=1550565 RepID=A0A498H1W0_9EURY|nr:STAS/SEC14 domain-containing protein [Methanoculleus taiwanensis]RXE56355.1 hypothetical protein ABH15_09635 [Methanoculleus taiwanensis]